MNKISLYKGYLRGDGKHAATKIIGKKLLTYETVRREPSYVGVMSNDYIMVDVDTKVQARKLLKIIQALNIGSSVLETTKGMHFYFRGYDLTTNKIGWYTPIGIKADFKLGIKNTADPLRIEGKTRHWVYKSDIFDPLPKWLIPLSNHQNHVAQLDAGERNQKLFNYILTLQRNGLSRDEIRATIRIINKYMLSSPLPDREVNTILRDDAFLKESFFGQKGAFLHDKFAKFLIDEHHIVTIAGVLHIYKDGVYLDDQAEIERAMIKHIPGLTKARRLEVLSYLQIQAKEVSLSSENYVALKNGIFNLQTWKLGPFTPNIVIKNKIPVDYVPDAYYEATDNTLNRLACGDKALRAVLEEIFGYVLFRRNELGKAFILIGKGSHGKSSYLKILRRLVGSDNTASVDLKELGQRFKTAELFGKLANIGDDIDNEFIRDSSIFKKLATGDAVNVERKGRDPFDFENYAKLVFSANEAPRIGDHSTGLSRRLVIVPFKAHFSKADPDFDPYISDKLMTDESMQYVLQLGLTGLKRLLKNNQFTEAKDIKAESRKYDEKNNPILLYLREEEPKFINESTKECYVAYVNWCAENGVKSLSQIAFGREVCDREGLTTKNQKVDGKQMRIFIEA